MPKLSALERKGIGEESGRIVTRTIMVEGKGIAKDIKMSPEYREITCLADFFKLLKEIHDKNEERLKLEDKELGSLFLYRGQGNVAYDYAPTILRTEKNIKREHILQKEFHRHFYEKMDSFKTLFDEEVLMQHYQVGSRCLDVLENPLMALWAACETDSNSDFKETFGEVSFWCLDYDDDNLKSYDSSTVSVIANTAICERYFSLGNLEINYHKEHPTELEDFIYLKDILRRTVVARPKYNNVHFQHQLNCFAIMNLNCLVDPDGNFYKKFGITVEQFSDYILNASTINKGKGEDYEKPNVSRLNRGLHTMNADFSELEPWDLHFEKMIPNDSPFVDTFDLYRYMYNESCVENERIPVFAVIPPKAKESIIKELEYANVTSATVYPDMDMIAKEMLKKYALKDEGHIG